MGKIGVIIRSLRRKEFWARFWGTFLAILALPSAILAMLGAHWSALSTSCLIIFGLLFSAVVNRKLLIKIHIPPSPDILLTDHSYLRCPCDLPLANEAKALAQESYPTDRSIAPERFEQLRVKNPYILACLTGPNRELLGYFDAIPLKENFADSFLKGQVTEMQITHEDVLGPNEMVACKFLFISGLAVRDPENQAGRISASILVWAIMKYINYFYGSVEPLIIALASSEAGDSLLRKFKFAIASDASSRVDQYTLYQLPLTRDAIAQRLACVPDWSALCSLDWHPDHGEKDSQGQKVSLPQSKAYNLPSPLSPKTA